MIKKVYFLSDVHLGAKSHSNSIEIERKLCRWLDSVKHDAHSIFLMGDIFDYWYEYKYVVPKGFTRLLGKLAELTDSGIEIHFFIGNHDIWLTDYLNVECGLILHFEPYIVDIYGHKFFLAHGDGLGDDSIKFQFLRKVFHSKFLRKCFYSIHPGLTIPLAHEWSNRSRINGGVADYLGEDNEHLVKFAKNKILEDPEIKYFIFGHRHILLNLPIADKSNVVILGDWVSYFSYAEFDGNSIQLKQWDNSSSSFS